MTTFEAVLLGIVQGVFMFVPVSSTSHLALTKHWLISRGAELPAPESPEMILFDLVVHVGTLVSIAIVLRRSLAAYLQRLIVETAPIANLRSFMPWRPNLHVRLTWLGLLAFFVTGIVGLALKDFFEQGFAHPIIIAAALILTGALLWWTDTFKHQPRGLRQIAPWVAVVIGLAQAAALMPGLSRSGMTIGFGLVCGLKRRWAAEFSLFLAFPTILAAAALQALEVAQGDSAQGISAWPLFAGFVVSAAVGCLALTLVLKLLYRAKFRYFSYYVWALAITVILWHFFGDASPVIDPHAGAMP